tara:strand:- start:374 stop:574 length:201 start_codon:yes stop_codon:yes gene_type:complete
MSLKTLLDYQLASDGKVDMPIEAIREYVIDELHKTESHKTICRVLETLLGLRVESTDNPQIKRIFK